MEKTKILDAIKRLAISNGGKAPGSEAFFSETGIRQTEWYPHLWLRWSDAVKEAGYAANQFNVPYSDDVLCQKFILLARELNHLPIHGEFKRKAKADKSFPSSNVFQRLGGKEKLLEIVLSYCKKHPGHEDIVSLIENHKPTPKAGEETVSKVATGFVYLMKSGRHYKIGRTISVGSRERQLAIKIPVPPTTIHTIETDDPAGVEAYWHRRFADRRGEGEWFDLTPEDVKAFKRWKRIV